MLDYLELCKQEVESQCRLCKVDKMLSNLDRPTISQATQNLALSEDDEISNKGHHKKNKIAVVQVTNARTRVLEPSALRNFLVCRILKRP